MDYILNKKASLPYLLIIIIGFLVYIHTLSFGLVMCDDHEIILKNYDRIESIGNLGKEIFTGYMETDYYRPVINTSFVVDAWLGGQSPFFYRLMNLIMHILTSCLVFYMLRCLKILAVPSLVFSILFIVHPLTGNAVAWIVGRSDIFMSFFGILSFITMIKWKENNKPLLLILHILSYLLSALSKETGLVFPLIFFLYIIFIRKDKIFSRSNLLIYISWVAILALWYILRSNSDLGSSVYITGFEVFIHNLRTIPEFAAKFVFPADLSVLPTYGALNTFVGSAVIILLIVASVFAMRKGSKLSLFGFAWFLVFTLPGMFMMLLSGPDWNDYLECRAYLPMIGLIIILAGILPEKWKSGIGKVFAVTSVIILLILGTLNYFNAVNYTGPVEFYESAVNTSPDRAKFHAVLGKLYMEENRLAEAENALKESIRCNPDYATYYYNLAAFYKQSNNSDKALEYFDKAISMDDASPAVFSAAAFAYSDLANYDKALELIEKGLLRFPDDTDLQYNAVSINMMAEKFVEADIAAYKLITKDQKTDALYALYNHTANSYYKKEEDEIAVRLWKKSIKINPEGLNPYKNLFLYYLFLAQDFHNAKAMAEEVEKRGGTLDKEQLKLLEGLGKK